MSDPIDVEGEIECDQFRVPEMYGLDFAATYEWYGIVTPDNSGDHVTPNGPPDVSASLGDLKSWTIYYYGKPIPKWLDEYLAETFAREMDDAFLAAIGGEDKLRELALEKAMV